MNGDTAAAAATRILTHIIHVCAARFHLDTDRFLVDFVQLKSKYNMHTRSIETK